MKSLEERIKADKEAIQEAIDKTTADFKKVIDKVNKYGVDSETLYKRMQHTELIRDHPGWRTYQKSYKKREHYRGQSVDEYNAQHNR